MRKCTNTMISTFIIIFLSVSFTANAVDNAYGVNSHNFPNEFLNNNLVKQMFVDLGVKWMRAEIPWRDIEPYAGARHYGAVDEIVKFAQLHDINILFILAKTPSFFGGGTKGNGLNPDHIDKWQIFVRDTVERYDGDGHQDMPGLTKPIKHWNLWNEPNLTEFWAVGTLFYPRQWTFTYWILQPGKDALRGADPTAKICGPELSSANDPKGWLKYMTDRLGPIFDVLTHHQYDGGDTPSGRYNKIVSFYNYAVSQGYGGKDFWITEIGWDKRDGFTDYQIANYLVDIMDYMRSASWWDKTFWYCFRDDHFGLMKTNTNLTEVYHYYKDYILMY